MRRFAFLVFCELKKITRAENHADMVGQNIIPKKARNTDFDGFIYISSGKSFHVDKGRIETSG